MRMSKVMSSAFLVLLASFSFGLDGPGKNQEKSAIR